MTLVKAAKVSEIKPGQMKIVAAGRTEVALCNVGGSFYAVENVCTHDDGPLGEGCLVDGEVECPRHGARFDLKTGQATRMPAIAPVRTFPVTIEGDDVLIEV